MARTVDEQALLAESYRTRAQQLRAMAEMDDQNETREGLLKIAMEYDRQAVRLSSALQQDKPLPF